MIKKFLIVASFCTGSTVHSPYHMNQLIEKIFQYYHFKKVNYIQQLGGFSSQNDEFIADGEHFVLKRYRSTREEDIKKIERITEFLFLHQMPVLSSLETYECKRHFVIGDAIFALFPKTEGKILHEPSLTKSALLATGSFLARFHQLDPSPLNLERAKILSNEEIEQVHQELLSVISRKSLGIPTDHLVKELIQIKKELKDNIISTSFLENYEKCNKLVHGDFHNENIIFNNKGDIVRLLDFEETHLGPQTEDIMHFAFLSCCNSGFSDKNLEKARLFIQAYEAFHPLSFQEFKIGLDFKLFKECNSFFLEKKLYQTGDPVFVKLLERDLMKFTYFKDNQNKKCWIESILDL